MAEWGRLVEADFFSVGLFFFGWGWLTTLLKPVECRENTRENEGEHLFCKELSSDLVQVPQVQ